jgi:hypothetical protein
MSGTNQIHFDAPATLRKWPSLNGERIPLGLGARPYLDSKEPWTSASSNSSRSLSLSVACTR